MFSVEKVAGKIWGWGDQRPAQLVPLGVFMGAVTHKLSHDNGQAVAQHVGVRGAGRWASRGRSNMHRGPEV